MRIRIFLVLLLSFGLIGSLSMVSAAPDHPEGDPKTKHVGEEGAGHGGAIPNKDVADKAGIKRYDLGIYTAIVFLLLFLILRSKAWGPIMKLLDDRENNIKNEYVDAETARKEALAALEEVKSQRAKATDEVRGMIEEARRDAQALKDKFRADAATEIQAERDRLRREIESARDQALQEIWSQTVQLASLVSSKAVKRELTPDDHRRLVDEAMGELKQNMARA